MTAMRVSATWAAACLVALARPADAQVDPSVRLMEEAASRHESTTTLCADFEQHLVVPLLGEEHSGRGRLCQAQPDLFAMRFSEPAGDAVVADGQWLWIYQPSVDAKAVLRQEMGGGVGGYDFHREFLHDPASKYDTSYQGEDQVRAHPTHRIRLTPRQDATYRSATIWLDRGSLALRQVRVEDENGSVRTVTLESIQSGQSAPAGWFTFRPPPGVQVITR